MTAPECTNCGQPRKPRPGRGGWQGGRGWCWRCYRRWWKHGCPEGGVPPALTRAQRGAVIAGLAREGRQARVAEYGRLRWLGFTIAQAADDVGVKVETARVYEREYREASGRRAA